MSHTLHQEGRKHLKVFESTLELVEGLWPTPLVKLQSFGEVWAKLEFFNALSRSIKDRVAYYILTRLRQERGNVKVVDATSGNYGIAIALLGTILNVDVMIVLPRKVDPYVHTILKVIGVETIHTDIETNNEQMIQFCRDLSQRLNAVFLNQFENDLNPEAHYRLTGQELAQQLREAGIKPDVLVVALGTSGHAAGISRALREHFNSIYVVGVVSKTGSFIPGIKSIDTYMKWREHVNEIIEVKLEEAVQGVIEVARREGLLIGLSSGAIMYALTRHIMTKLGKDRVYVVVFPDDLFKYVLTVEKVLEELRVGRNFRSTQ